MANKEYWPTADPLSHRTHCARVSCAETSGVENGQRFQHFAARVQRVQVGEDLTLILDLRCAKNKPAKLYTKADRECVR